MKIMLLVVVALLGVVLLIMGKFAIGLLIMLYCIGFIVYQAALFFAEPENEDDIC